jgi:hypothetical protein
MGTPVCPRQCCKRSSEIFLNMPENESGFSCEFLYYFWLILIKNCFYQQILAKLPNVNCHDGPSTEGRVLSCGQYRRTDRQADTTKLINGSFYGNFRQHSQRKLCTLPIQYIYVPYETCYLESWRWVIQHMLLTFWRNPLHLFSAWKSKSGEETSFLPCNTFSCLFSSDMSGPVFVKGHRFPLAGSQFHPLHFATQCLHLRVIPTFCWRD